MRHDLRLLWSLEGLSMTRGLLQQQPGLGWEIPRQAASPQHGQKAAPKPVPVRESRTYKPKPDEASGH